MRPFTFNPGPRLLAGPDQATALAEKLPPGPCLLVTDADLTRLGLSDSYREAIGKDRDRGLRGVPGEEVAGAADGLPVSAAPAGGTGGLY